MRRIGIYGTGRIGTGQATLTAGNGYETVVIGHSADGIERCRQSIVQNWDDMIRQGVAAEANRDAALALTTLTDDPKALRGCDVVFEAVTEDLAVKRAVYDRIGEHCSPDTVIASCTSSIPVETLAGTVRSPERFLIAHPFQPVHLLPLVEVVPHDATDPRAKERLTALLDALGRQVVVLRKCRPGFLVNRLAQALFRESLYLIEQGVCSAQDIDRAMKYAVGMRYASIGLLEYFDDVGFDLESRIAANVYPDLCRAEDIQPKVEEGLRTGHTGRIAGQGLYDWSGRDQEDYSYRKQAPYFSGVLTWNMPGG